MESWRWKKGGRFDRQQRHAPSFFLLLFGSHGLCGLSLHAWKISTVGIGGNRRRSRSGGRSRSRSGRRRNRCSSRFSIRLCLSRTNGLPGSRCRGRKGWRRRSRDDRQAGGAEAVRESVNQTYLGRAGVMDLEWREEGRE